MKKCVIVIGTRTEGTRCMTGDNLHPCVVVVSSCSSSSSSSALRSRSTSTGLLPLVSRPRSLSAARNSITFNLDGSIVRARCPRLARLVRRIHALLPFDAREKILTKDPYTRATDPRCIHNMAGRLANISLRSARRGDWLAARSFRTDAARAANRVRRLIRNRARRVRRLARAKAGRTAIGSSARRSCEFERDALTIRLN